MRLHAQRSTGAINIKSLREVVPNNNYDDGYKYNNLRVWKLPRFPLGFSAPGNFPLKERERPEYRRILPTRTRGHIKEK